MMPSPRVNLVAAPRGTGFPGQPVAGRASPERTLWRSTRAGSTASQRFRPHASPARSPCATDGTDASDAGATRLQSTPACSAI